MADRQALLILEDGSTFRGIAAGATVRGYGELVFNTSMTGYEEILTDPSYAGQIVTMTYPLIGNYGTSAEDVESRNVQAAALVMREECESPSHWRSSHTLQEFLTDRGVPAIAGIDTRALTRRLRSGGVQMAAVTCEETADDALAWLRQQPRYGSTDLAREVATREPYGWKAVGEPRGHIVVLDTGVKYNILRLLNSKGYRTTTVSCTTPAEDVLALRPDGIVLSPGPGDPTSLDYVVNTVKGLIGKTPILGICLGHQVLGQLFGASTYKLKFGHHGGNHPVRDLATNKVYITSQNHGYAVDADGLTGGAELSHLNLNDNTCEGLCHRAMPIISIQYHSEAAPGPRDNMYIFDRFLDLVRSSAGSVTSAAGRAQ